MIEVHPNVSRWTVAIQTPSEKTMNRGTEGSGGTSVADEWLCAVDEDLAPLMPMLRAAVETRRLVVALGLWQRVRFLTLFPFHLHLQWPDYIEQLPLNASFAVVPCFDASLMSLPLYRVSEVNDRRQAARLARHKGRRSCSLDFRHTDWERGFDRHRETLQAMVLPGASFIAVDAVSPAGIITKGHRSVLGRLTVRDGLRPFIHIPSKQGVTAASASAFAIVNLLIINA
jgi:hypothetical protein